MRPTESVYSYQPGYSIRTGQGAMGGVCFRLSDGPDWDGAAEGDVIL